MAHNKSSGSFVRSYLTLTVIIIMVIPIGMITVSRENTVSAQDTQVPEGWVKFNPHSHGMFDIHDDNDSVVGTIDESHVAGLGFSTGDTIPMIRDEFGGDGVFVHTPHAANFEPYKHYWEAERRYENSQYSTTTNVTLGEEYNHFGRHIGLVNLTYFRSTSDYTTFKELRSNITSQGAVMIINHPSEGWIGDPQIFLQPWYEFDGMEIYNGRVELVDGPLARPETDGRTHYRNAITQGRLLTAIGGSDAHNTMSGWQVYTVCEDPLGEKNLDAVVRAIRNRRTYAAAYDMGNYDRTFFLESAEMGTVIETRDFSLNISPPSASSYTVDLYKNNETIPVQSWSLTGDDTVSYTIPVADALENAVYSFEIYEGSSASSSNALAYSSAIWYQPDVEYNLSLSAGWNLISFPLILASSNINDVLSSITGDYDVVHWYNPNTDSWMIHPGADFEMNNTMSFWIHMKHASTLHHTGKMPFYTRVPLYSSGSGWTMAGFPSMEIKSVNDVIQYIPDKVIALRDHNSEDTGDPWKHYHKDKDQNDLHSMEPGSGYWIKVNDDCELVMFN